MKVLDPFIFDINDDIEEKNHGFGYEFFNVFKYPDKIVDFCMNEIVYQNCHTMQGYAPLYRVKFSFHIPPLLYFIHKLIEKYYSDSTVKNIDVSSNICKVDIFKKQINSLPHLDNGVDVIVLFYLHKTKNGTLLWKNKYSQNSAAYRASLAHDTAENLKKITHESFEYIGKSSGEYNSAFCFNSSKVPHNIDYWSGDLIEEDRLVLLANVIFEKK